MASRARLLHVFPTFGPGGTELRMASIINGLGDAFVHTIIALNGKTGAADRLNPNVAVEFLPPPAGRGGLLYPLELRRAVLSRRPDLLVTYNWGAIDAVLGCMIAPPCSMVHNECGFGPDEASHLKTRRVWTRRIALRRVFCTIVVSRLLDHLARTCFLLPGDRLRFIQTGVDTERFTPHRNEELRQQWGMRDDSVVFGFAGGLRGEKNLHLLLTAFSEAALPSNAHLVLIGDGPDRTELEQLSGSLGIRGRVSFRGHASEISEVMPAFDVFVMSSRTEQTPNALLEAMACGLPVIATNVGDCAALVGAAGASFIVGSNDRTGYASALRRMAASRDFRRELGALNRTRAVTEFSKTRMIQEYRDVYDAAVRAR
jgi:L-malate glycosyltransferase